MYNIDEDIKEKFAKNLQSFAVDYSLKLEKDFLYSQCGKTRYYTKSE